MFSVQELRFAQKYPFSGTARHVVKDSGLTLDSVSDQIISRAASMVAAAFTDKPYYPEIRESRELLRNEILAFPVAKVMVSLIGRLELYRKFSSMCSDSVFKNLEQEKDEVLLDMASEFRLKVGLSESLGHFAEMRLTDYLKPSLDETFMKLVNSELEGGKVFLGRNDFARFISLVFSQELQNSLPVETKGAPVRLSDLAARLEKQFAETIRKKYSKSDFGDVAPESFPPCMAKIYSELASGMNANHSARFAMATFLNSIGMGVDGIVSAYSATPNFKEHVTRYQVKTVAEKNYSAPSCDKMRSYNLCVANCPVTHPVQFYGREVSKEKQAPTVVSEK
ncbi:MAG: hypothetical protein NUV67_04390 [archaeon]|nr:hypothetical protein [archaeon]